MKNKIYTFLFCMSFLFVGNAYGSVSLPYDADNATSTESIDTAVHGLNDNDEALATEVNIIDGNVTSVDARVTTAEADIVTLEGEILRASDYADLATAISTIGATNATLIIDSAESLSANATFPATLSVEINKPGCITRAAGVKLTINGSFEAGLYQVFDGDGSVIFGTSAVEIIYPQWWKTYHDGVSDDAPAVDKAITACLSSGGHIVLTPGDWYWISTVPEIHEEIPDMLIISGYGATIHLCNNAPTAFNLKSLSGNQTEYIQNILLEGYNVDAHDSGVWNVTGGTTVGCIVTCAYVAPDYYYPTNTSIRNITIRDIIAKNVLETTYDTNTTGMYGISIGLQSTTNATEITDIFIDNINVDGGRCAVGISRQTIDAGNTNTWIDNIIINNVYHEISEEKSGFYWAANIMVGGGGRCGNVIISNCYGKNSGDVGIELDCAENGIIKNVVIDNSKKAAFFIKNYAEPANLENQSILLEDCSARYIDSTWSGDGPSFGFQECGGISNTNYGVMRNCKYTNNNRTHVLSSGQYIRGRADKLLVDGFAIEETCNFAGSYATEASLVGIYLNGCETYLSNIRANIDFVNSSNVTMNFELVRLENVDQLVINKVNLDLACSGTGSFDTGYLIQQRYAFGGGSMKNVKANTSGIDIYPLHIKPSGSITSKFVTENCDFSGISSFLGLVKVDAGVGNVNNYYSRLRFRQNDYPASEAIYASYNIGANATVVKNDNFRKGHFFPDSGNVTLIEESYDHGSNYISAGDVSKVTLVEGSWVRVTSGGAHSFDFYFADD